MDGVDSIAELMVAPWILWRYLLRDIFFHAVLGLMVCTLLLVVQNTLRFLEELMAAGVGTAGLIKVVALVLPSYLPYAIPTSLLFGVLLAFGRMSADGEIVAIRSSGISVPRLLPPVFALGLIAMFCTAQLVFEVEPNSRRLMKETIRDLASTVKFFVPGDFRNLGDRTIYVHGIGDEACPLQGILIGDFSQPERTSYVAAECGKVAEAPETRILGLTLLDGSIHFPSNGEEDRYDKIEFVKMRMDMDMSSYIESARKPRDFTMPELFVLDKQFDRGENPDIRGGGGQRAVRVQIQRRIAFPFAALVLAFLSVPLGIRPLRSGRSAGALTAIGVMALYWCLFTAAEISAESGLLPPVLALWSPNFAVTALGFFMLRKTIRGDT